MLSQSSKHNGDGMTDDKDIEKKADEFTEVYSEPPIPVYEIARKNKVKVYTEDFEELADRFSGFCDFESDTIYLNKEDAPKKQFFTAAHEFGHWVLHRNLYISKVKDYALMPKRRAFVDSASDNPEEKQADYFATCLLMPRLLVEKFCPHYLSPELAEMFNVPRVLIEKRLEEVLWQDKMKIR